MNTEYEVGALSALGKNHVKSGKRSKKLVNLFEKSGKQVELFREAQACKNEARPPSASFELAPLGTRRKWHEDGDSADDDKKDPAFEKPGISKRKLHKQRLKRRLNPDVLPRTIFVGNLPIKTTKKQLMKMFKKFGSIESARIRCAPVADEKTPKRVAAITRQYHPDSESIIGYIKFKTSEDANKALAMNGEILSEHHLRVDLAKGGSLPDHHRSVFVGNLPFNVKEEVLQAFFEDAGKIESVRVIRDPLTRVGKGFGYVLFEDKGSVELALRANNCLLEGREIRVKRSTSNPKPYLPPKIPANKQGKFNKMQKERQEAKKSKLQQNLTHDTKEANKPKMMNRERKEIKSGKLDINATRESKVAMHKHSKGSAKVKTKVSEKKVLRGAK